MPVSGSDFRGRRVVVWGLGRFAGGVGVARWLASAGASVKVVDRATPDALADSVRQLSGLSVEYDLGREDPATLDDAEMVVVNPAILKSRSPYFAEIIRRGITWTTETNLFVERCPAQLVGVTGTFGKSTTSAMLAAVLAAARPTASSIAPPDAPPRVFLGGNIGRCLLGDLAAMTTADWVVLEMSNAQLEDMPAIGRRPRWAVITNLSPHHLSRHGSFEAYVETKCHIFGNAGRTACVVLGPLHDAARPWVRRRLSEAGVRWVEVPTSSAAGRFDLRLPGEHNQANARCAAAVGRELGLDDAAIRAALAEFGGLRHRLEHVGRWGGVMYINDSKSTSPACTAAAAASFNEPLVAIVGGAEVEDELTECCRFLARRCRAVIVTGASAAAFEAGLHQLAAPGQRRTPVIQRAATVDDAVRQARAAARPGDVVLFSPGATSFDRYPNYEARGDDFVRCVRALSGSV